MATVSFGSFSKRRNSTKQPATLSDQRTVTLKESCSQDRPVFRCTGNNFNYNYCMWDGKYYFIDEIVSLHNNEIEIHCILDPLATYKAEILASTQYVCYSSHNSSSWLADLRIPLLQSTDTNVNTQLTGILSSIGTYVLTVVGKNGCSIYYTQNEANLDALLNDISTWENDLITAANSLISTVTPPYHRGAYQVVSQGSSVEEGLMEGFQSLCDCITSALEAVGETMSSVQDAANVVLSTVENASVEVGAIGNAYANAPACIRSCIWVPFDYARANAGSGQSPIYLGNFPTSVSMPSTNAKPVTDSVSINIPWHYSDWRRGICEDVYLFLPLVGMIQLSADSLTHRSSLTIDWSVTYTDGAITYKVRSGSEVIGTYGGQCAAQYPLGINQQASAGEVIQSAIQGIEKMVSGLVESTISPISAGAAVGGLALNGVMAGYNVENVKKSSHVSCVGGSGGGAGIGLGREICCYTVAHAPAVNPADMKDTMGLPTMQPMSLSTLTGFCQCSNAHVEAPATAGELDAIDAYLNSGFFIE